MPGGAGWPTRGNLGSGAPRYCNAARRRLSYAEGVNLMGATGFDVGCEPSGAYRGCSIPRKYLLQIIVANDDNYALAA
jgi:hypothetical protein